MAETNKTSFLGAINPWSRANTPPPKSPRQVPKDEGLQSTSGQDHSINNRPSPSLRKYPKDCPALKARWYYAVDIAKRKPFVPEPTSEGDDKAKPVPRKWMLFSTSDSQAIENAFQQLGRDDEFGDKNTATKVPVNEDYLYDVHIEKRELEPTYWIGPVYDVRRGSWFFQESMSLRPCDENLANQLEEGYLKATPWRKTGAPRSASQPRHRMASSDPATQPPPTAATTETPASNTHRLFGAHMNTTVTYADASTAYLSSDDFMSWMRADRYGRLGGQGGTKVVRGWSEQVTLSTTKPAEPTSVNDKQKPKVNDVDEVVETERSTKSTQKAPPPPRPSALERQLSSLAGLTQVLSRSQDEQRKEEEEEARIEEQAEMEDARETDGQDQGRKIDHLVLVTHGIGQRLGLRLDSINFVHDVNTMRKTMKAVFEASPELQALAGDDARNCRVQVLPVCWRHLLDFPKQSLKHNRKEHDLGDIDEALEEEYPSLQDITVDGVPAVRNLITDLALDVLLYQSAYREHIATIVQQEVNRVYQLFKSRTGFNGTVSLCGHSLGSAVFFDILCRQAEDTHHPNRPHRVSSRTHRELAPQPDRGIQLDFTTSNFFALGSPIALFQMLKGRTIAGRVSQRPLDQAPPVSPFDSDLTPHNPFQSLNDISSAQSRHSKDLIPITTSSPRCADFYNIFHPTDPIAYRIEPLISPAMSVLKPQALPYTKRGLFDAPGMANLTARVSQQVMSSWYSLTSGVASSLINRSLGITGEEQVLPHDKPKPSTQSITTLNQPSPLQSSDVPKPQQQQNDLTKKQRAITEAALKSTTSPAETPTLIESEMETLYSGFEKSRRRHSHQSTTSTSATSSKKDPSPSPPNDPSDQEEQLQQENKARRLRREEAKVLALNSNGRVDYHIQEGMFDVSLLASIASHLSYWADADVGHFMLGEMLKRKEREKEGEQGRKEKERDGGGGVILIQRGCLPKDNREGNNNARGAVIGRDLVSFIFVESNR